MQAAKGSFSAPTSTGNSAVTGTGFQPKALILWTNRVIAEGFIANSNVAVGFCASATQRKACSVSSSDAVSPSVTAKRMANLAISVVSGTGTVQVEADFVSFDADGFTLNWTTAGAGKDYIVHYLALGGADLTNVFVGDKLWGSVTGNVAVTGVGFQPDCVLMFGTNTGGALPYAVTVASFDLCAFTSTSQKGSSAYSSHHAQNPSKTTSWQKAEAMASVQPSSDGIEMEGDLVTMDADGFTLNLTTANNDRFGFMALKGGSYWVGQDTQKTSTGTQAKTGVGFKPAGLFLFGCNAAANASIDATQGHLVIGGTDGTHEGCTWIGDQDNVVTTVADSCSITTKTIRHANEVVDTVQAEASISSRDADGYTLNWTTADATAREFNVVAFGPLAEDTGLAWIRA